MIELCLADSMHPLESVKWGERTANLQGGKRQMRVIAPEAWSDTAVDVFASHYLRVVDGEQETHFGQAMGRVAGTISGWAREDGYLSDGEAHAFRAELEHMLVYQMWSPNSPVWYNIGCAPRPQISACFIQSVLDSMEGEQGIIALQSAETRLFMHGSGTGTNLSTLRPNNWPTSRGGTSSGPVSFMRGFDGWAGVTKSGGKTRRAAKMTILNASHPDIFDFIGDKAEAERMANALVDAGWPADYNSKAYSWLPFQNANNSVRVTDEFMHAVKNNRQWSLTWDGKTVREVRARDLWDAACKAAWHCGDPGLQFHTTANRWHTSPAEGEINASNPCQPDFAQVLTPNGIRTFGEVQVGDTIWSGKRWTRITKKWCTGVKDVYEYQTTAGVFVGTKNHRVVSHGVKVEVQDAETIDTSSGPVQEQYTDLNPQDVMDGWVLGDGSVHKASGGLVYLCIGENDRDIHQWLPSFIKCHRPGLSPYAWEVITTIQACEIPHTYLRKIPHRFYAGNPSVVRGFLRGLYSANGSVVASRVTLKATSLVVVRQVQDMLSAIGIRSYFTHNVGKEVEFSNGGYQCRDSYDLNISTDRGKFAAAVGFVQSYKNEKLSQTLKRKVGSKGPKTSYEVRKTEYLGEFPVYDITVEAEEHTYWTGGLLVSNCSEYFFLDDSACNLASLNLRKFKKPDEPFQVNQFKAACERSILAQEVMVSWANYPTRTIGLNSEKYRPLGLGYSNLGALLMSEGLAYDSPEGCAYAAAITALMTASAYQASQKIAAVKGPYEGSRIGDNAKAMREVLDRHASALNAVPWTTFDDHKNVALAAAETFVKVVNSSVLPRNAQVTLLAPTGTISFGMDCDTFGIEPDFSLVKHKRMAGGGFMKYANRSVESALRKLGYGDDIEQIVKHVEEYETLDSCTLIRREHRSVFDCAVPAKKGWRSISFEGHVNMMAAVQPFLSGAISKTVNLPHTATVEDISRAYMMAWEKGLKAIAIYRDGCKRSQPLDTGTRDSINYKHPHVQRALAEVAAAVGLVGESWTASSLAEQIKLVQPQRHRLPDTRQSLCHRFSVGGHDGYLHPGFHADGTLGEIFVRMAKEGSTVSGLLDAWATAFSIALQYGAPLEKLCEKGMGTSFPPSGFTGDEMRSAKSVVDYICSWLHKHYCQPNTSVTHMVDTKSADALSVRVVGTTVEAPLTAGNPPCGACGGDTVRAGSCYTCTKCGTTTGCG